MKAPLPNNLASIARWFVFGITAAFAAACGAATTNDGAGAGDASLSGSGGQSGASGGSSSGGNGVGGDGQGGSLQAAGAGGSAMSVDGSSVACRDDGGRGLASAARHCAADPDCQILIGQTCCGADSAFGIAKAEVAAYSSCVGLPVGACQGLGCAKFLGYIVDTGEMTVFLATQSRPLDQVAVHCKNELCTTNVIALDAGRD